MRGLRIAHIIIITDLQHLFAALGFISQELLIMTMVSVVISAHNASPWIAETLESIFAQTFRDFELIVVDDGSTDDTRQVVARYGPSVRLITIGRSGKSTGKNTGIRAAKGDYIAFVDADDLWTPEKLELQVELLRRQPDLAWAYADGYLFDDSTGKTVGRFGQIARLHSGNILRSLLLVDFIASPTPIVRRDILERVGCFDETLLRHQPEDWDLWLRIAADYPVGLVNQPLVRYRLHAASLTAREEPRSALEGQVFVVERAVARHPECLGNLRNRAIANLYLGTGRVMARNGNTAEAREMFAWAIRLAPYDLRHYGYWLATFTGAGLGNLIAMRRWMRGPLL